MDDLRFAKVSDMAPIRDLHLEVSSDCELSRLDWLTEMNPAGPPESFAAIEIPSGRVVACVQTIPQRILLDGEPRRAAQLIDGLTLPEFRGRRIFNRLTRMVLRETSAEYEFVIGFPNDLSIGPCLRAGFDVFTPMSTFILALKGRYLGRRVPVPAFLQSLVSGLAAPLVSLNLVRSARGSASELIPRPDAGAATAPRRAEPLPIPHPTLAVRDDRFIAWRFFEVPGGTYRYYDVRGGSDVVGYAVLRDSGADREIVDLCLPAEPAVVTGTLQALVRESRTRGFESLQIQCPPTDHFASSLRKCGFWEVKDSARVILYPLTDRARTLRPEDYFLTRADSDWI